MNSQPKDAYLSIVLPIYNEEGSLPELMGELYSVCDSLRISTDTGRIVTDNGRNPELLYGDLTYKIRGAIFKVYNTLGFGHKESAYQKALEHEFDRLGLVFESQKNIDLIYDGKKVGTYKPDILVENKIVLELKSSHALIVNDKEQVLKYLRGTNYNLALVVNFGASKLQIERIINTALNQRESQSISENQSLNQRESVSYEIIFINDCSTDRTYEMLCQYAEKDERIKVIRFSRNFRHQAAISAGLDASSGEIVVTMDSDLQHPPEVIKEFIKQAEAGYDIVIAERMAVEQRSFLRDLVGKAIYKFLSVATGLEFKNAGDFVLYKRKVVDVIKKLPEREKFFRGLAQWVGFKKKYVPYTVRARKFGKGVSVRGLARFILNGVTSFSAFPLRISFWVGLIIFLGSVGYGVSIIIEKLLYPENLIEGLSALTLVVLALGSIQLMVIGVIGEYLYKMFNEIKGRPVYIIAETKNLDL